MKSLTIENQGLNQHLVYAVEKSEKIDTLALGMLTNNTIAGIAPVIQTQMDDEVSFKYNITDKISAKEYFSGVVNKKRLLNVFSGVVAAISAAEEYMIDINTMLFDLDYIYVNPTTGKSEMLCVPIISDNIEPMNLGLFFKNIMFSTQFDPNENSNYVAVIMNFLNSSPTFSAENFKNTIDSLMSEGTVEVSAERREPVNNMPQNQTSAGVGQNITQNSPAPSIQASAPMNSGNGVGNVVPQASASATLNGVSLNKKNSAPAQQINQPNTPVVPPAKQGQVPQNNVGTESDGKEISWFYLMQHYNKDNVALYKAQKQQKKDSKSGKSDAQVAYSVPGAPSISTPQGQPVAKAPAAKTPAGGFAIPGQSAPAPGGFAIPGQSVPAPGQSVPSIASQPVAQQNKGFKIGGKSQKLQGDTNQQVQAAQTPIQAAPSPQPTYTPPPLAQGTANFGETVVLNQDMGGGETTVLSAAMQNTTPYLIRVKTGERIMVDKPLFRIGKEKSVVDYFIPDNTTISRNHMNIITRNNEYFAVDLKSTNHTYINGSMIPDNVETKISHGTRIRISNEEFEFNTF